MPWGDLVATRVAHAVGHPRILVGLDGPGASGKSTLAEAVAAGLEGAVVVHTDDFYLPRAGASASVDGVGARYDLARLARQVVAPAAGGGALRYQRYDWGSDTLTEWVDVPADVPVVVEGVYAMARRLRDAYTYAVFCRCDPATRLRRGLERDGEGARAMWLQQWMPAEDDYLAQEHPDDFADLVLDSSLGEGTGGTPFQICRCRH
jgi:uridine kinase